MRLRRLAVALLWIAAPLLAGCFQSSTLVKLNPDGSGTIERTTTVTAELYARVQAPGDDDPFSTDKARRAGAGAMGNGVTFVSADRIDTPARKGIKTVYTFSDIGAVSLDAFSAPDWLDTGTGPDNAITFAFSRLPDGHSLLTIKNDVDGLNDAMTAGIGGAAKPRPGSADDKRTRDLMKAMLTGLKIDVAIQVGHLLKTSVPYVNGDTVTLLSMDFDQVLANPAALEKADKAKSMADTITALRSIKGIKLTLDPELTIEFTR